MLAGVLDPSRLTSTSEPSVSSGALRQTEQAATVVLYLHGPLQPFQGGHAPIGGMCARWAARKRSNAGFRSSIGVSAVSMGEV
jgi:hypothetical protein